MHPLRQSARDARIGKMAAVNRPNAPQNYRTPPEFLAAVVRRFGPLVWDAACTRADCVGSAGGYAIDSGCDAMLQDWSELRDVGVVWCNPPWARAGEFAARAATSGAQVLLLCQAAVDSNWYAAHVHGRALVLALNPRIPFLNPDGSPAFVDRNGKPLGVNRPTMLAAYNFGQNGQFEPWKWKK